MRTLQQFGSGEGSVIVEYAIIAPILFALVFAVVDFSRIFLAKSYATDTLVELSNYYRYEMSPDALKSVSLSHLQAKAQSLSGAKLGGLANMGDVSVSLSTYRNISDLVNGMEGKNTDLFGGAGDLVKYNLHYTVSPLTPFADYLYPSAALLNTVTLVLKNGT
ncbi:pilus assembly protein [Sneathiella marina]|uniref:Pilus assembly protein n=1 Tax=Sneathiella marina TaxID=2950108 RepID=A0ABY4W7A1_9PROT|nr:TadE family protein [Sneathiella marina]USG63043.1 pilus assembly protein [Sneathiella marina]